MTRAKQNKKAKRNTKLNMVQYGAVGDTGRIEIKQKDRKPSDRSITDELTPGKTKPND